MSENNEEKKEEKVIVDISCFYTKESSEKGVWMEPNIGGKIGIEFRVIGSESDEAAEILADYDKALAKIDEIKDPKARNEQTRVALATATSKLVKGIRGADGVAPMVGDKPLTYSPATAYAIMYNSFSIANEILRFSRKATGFMEKK